MRTFVFMIVAILAGLVGPGSLVSSLIAALPVYYPFEIYGTLQRSAQDHRSGTGDPLSGGISPRSSGPAAPAANRQGTRQNAPLHDRGSTGFSP
jgi:hypothetical protein